MRTPRRVTRTFFDDAGAKALLMTCLYSEYGLGMNGWCCGWILYDAFALLLFWGMVYDQSLVPYDDMLLASVRKTTTISLSRYLPVFQPLPT